MYLMWLAPWARQAPLMAELRKHVCEPREAKSQVAICSPKCLWDDSSDHIEMKTFGSAKETSD